MTTCHDGSWERVQQRGQGDDRRAAFREGGWNRSCLHSEDTPVAEGEPARAGRLLWLSVGRVRWTCQAMRGQWCLSVVSFESGGRHYRS